MFFQEDYMRKRQQFKEVGSSIGESVAIGAFTTGGGGIGAVGGAAVYIMVAGGSAALTSTAIGAFFSGPPGWIAWLTLALGTAVGAAAGYGVGQLEEEYIGVGQYVGGKVGHGVAAITDYFRGDDERAFIELEERVRTHQARADAKQAEAETKEGENAQLKRELEEAKRLIRQLNQSKENESKSEQKVDTALHKQNALLRNIHDSDVEIIQQFTQKIKKLAEEKVLLTHEKDIVVAVHQQHMAALDDLVRCPISLRIMQTPITPGDGHSYEDKELRKYCNEEATKKGKIFMPDELYKKFKSSGKESLEEKEEAKYICSPLTRTPLLPQDLWRRDINMQNLIDQYRQSKKKLKTSNHEKEEKYENTNSQTTTTETVSNILVGQQFRAIGNSTTSSLPLERENLQVSTNNNSNGFS
jgi:hypothetical protein